MESEKPLATDLKFLPGYAQFLLDNHLHEFAEEQLRLSRQLKIPLLKFFEELPHEQILQILLTSTGEFLRHIAANQASEYIKKAVARWQEDRMPQITQGQVLAEDITLLNHVRKQVLLYFMKHHTADVDTIIGIVSDVDKFVAAFEAESFGFYKQLMSKTTEQLKRSEGQLLAAQELAEMGSFEWNLETRQGSVTPQLLKILGYSDKNELNFFSDNVHACDKERVRDLTAKAIAELSLYDYECRFVNGSTEKILWARGDVSLVNGAKVVKGTIMNVTQRHEMLQQLQENYALFNEAQALAHIGNWTWDVTTDSINCSDELYRIYGLEPQSEPFNFQKFVSFIHVNDRSKTLQFFQSVDEASEPGGHLFRITTADGQSKIISAKREIRTNDDGKMLRVTGTCQDVTERQLLIDKLQQSEALFKQAQAISHTGSWALDLVKNEITWTEEMYRIYNLSTSQKVLRFEELFFLTHPEDVDNVQAELQKSLAKGHHDFIYRILLHDGSVKTVHSKGETLYNQSGSPYKMIGTAQDVTAQKQIEKQLLQNQHFIHKIADTTPSIITTYNVNTGRYQFVSKGLYKLLGYQPDELLEKGTDFVEPKIHPDDLNIINAKRAETISLAGPADSLNDTNILTEYQFRIKNSEGNFRWLQTYVTVFDRNSKGKVENLLNISFDITDTIERERLLNEQRHFIDRVAEASPTILYVFDLAEKRFVYINREVKEVLGYEPEEILANGDRVTGLYLHPYDDLPSSENYSRKASLPGGGTMRQFEGRVKNKEGKWVWILTREIVFKRDDKGKPLQVLGSALDITLRREIEDTLRYKTHQLQQSNSSLEEFAHIASHDLQEPLRKIVTFGDRLSSTNKHLLTDDGKNYLQKIVSSARRMQRLVKDILSVSLIAADQHFEVCRLETLLEEVKQTLEYKIDEKKAIITSDGLPTATVNCTQIRQLFQNIISNSLKFTKPNEAPVIKITHRFIRRAASTGSNLSAANSLEITIADNGIGFDNEFSEKIFSIFQRLNDVSMYEGTGIGLSICKKIAENHGGNITAASSPGNGATFTITLPVSA